MRAKEMLKSVRPLRQELSLLKQQEQLMLSPKAITYDGIRVQTSPQDRMFETVEAIQKLERLIQTKERELAEKQLEAMAMIYSLEKTEWRKLLILYYIDGEKQRDWNEVADAMGYSESRVKHMHGWALKQIDEHLEKDSTRKHSSPC